MNLLLTYFTEMRDPKILWCMSTVYHLTIVSRLYPCTLVFELDVSLVDPGRFGIIPETQTKNKNDKIFR